MIIGKKKPINAKIFIDSSNKINKDLYYNTNKKMLLLKNRNYIAEKSFPIKVNLLGKNQNNANKSELKENIDKNNKNIINNNKIRIFSSFLLKQSYKNNSKISNSSSFHKKNIKISIGEIANKNKNNDENQKTEINRLKELLCETKDNKKNNNINLNDNIFNIKIYKTEINENNKNKNFEYYKEIKGKNINKDKIYNLIYKKNKDREKKDNNIVKDFNILKKNIDSKSEQKENGNKHKIRNILSKNFAFSKHKYKTLDLLNNNKRYSNKNKSSESTSYINTINNYEQIKKDKNENEVKSLKSNNSKDTIKKTSSINTKTTTSNITEKRNNIKNNILSYNFNFLNDNYGFKLNANKSENNSNKKENYGTRYNLLLKIGDNKSVELKNKLDKFNYLNDIDNLNLTNNNYKNENIEIKLDELILYEEKLNDVFIAINSFNNMENVSMDNECSDFFQFYSNSSLKNKLFNFFSEDNYIIIQSSINLQLFIIMLIYKFSFYNQIMADSITSLIDIFSKLKINLYLLIKQILIYYNKIKYFENEKNKNNMNILLNILKNSELYSINILEDEIILNINDNCTSISNNVHNLLNLFSLKNNMDTISDELTSIFNQLSIINEDDIIIYFYKYIYIEDDNINKQKHKSNKKKAYNIFLNYKHFNYNIKLRNNSRFKQNNTENNIYQSKGINSLMKDINNKDNNPNDDIEQNNNEKIKKNNNNYITVFCIKKKNNINSRNNINNNYNINSNIIPPFIKVPRQKNKKYTLILDLDETLVHVKQININTQNNNLYLNNSYNNNFNQKIINIRPGLFAFLNGVKPYYELISFSSASKEYADNILNKIEYNQKYFEYNLFREHTTLYGNEYIKDISKVGRNIKEIIIIDNLEKNFVLNPDNGIKISSYFGEINPKKEDNKLYELLKLLILFHKLKYRDLRMAIKDYSQFIIDKISSD